MLFNSLEFAVFFPVVCALYFALPFRARVPLLLVASCVFYMAFVPAYILILASTIGVDYTAAIYLERTTGSTRRALLVLSIAVTCAILFVFKYFNFFTGTFVGLATLFGWHPSPPTLQLVLPIGLSFHTFQSLSYVVEVYRGRQRAEHDFATYATYVMFFPQLVAGPIERPQNLLQQFREHHQFEYERVTSGLRRMAWGFFKKLVVADRLALYVNDVYAAPADYTGLQLTIATVFFAYQIYCDFSGYSDIALGTAQVLGFRLMENFATPYHSASVGEFWRRWHISLSTWFRDYVYIPLGGSRTTAARRSLNVLVTFAISGLWHGAAWTYVLWGLLNGLYLVVGGWTQPLRDRLAALSGFDDSIARRVGMVATTFALTCFAWVLFRADSVADAWYIYSHWFRDWDFANVKTPNFSLRSLVVALAAIVGLELLQLWRARPPAKRRTVSTWPVLVRWPAYAGFVFVLILFGVYRSTQFIYFQF